jgi:7-cyano-7-deazaguanine synthase
MAGPGWLGGRIRRHWSHPPTLWFIAEVPAANGRDKPPLARRGCATYNGEDRVIHLPSPASLGSMSLSPTTDLIGVLASGGLDSAILVGHLLAQGRRVQPFYIRTGLVWQRCELASLRRFLRAIAAERLSELVELDLPLADLYDGHWSLTGDGTPGTESPDEAVFLPGRNALLIVKAAIWCQLHGIGQLALAPLGSSPFEDASAAFLGDFEAAINRGARRPIELFRPFGDMTKQHVMHLGRELPLHLTFSCIAPVGELHCGRCNKCAERQAAFRDAGIDDRTVYATVYSPVSNVQSRNAATGL